MNTPLNITGKKVQEKLDENSLNELLDHLLRTEVDKFGLPRSSIETPFNDKIPDGGEDSRAYWSKSIQFTTFIPSNFTIFQVKAQKMPPKECKKELFDKSGKRLKTQLKKLFDNKGAYIVFCSQDRINNKLRHERINRIKEGLKEAGYSNADSFQIDFYDAEKIANWINTYLQSIHFFLEKYEGIRSKIFNTWQTFLEKYSHSFKSKFVSNWKTKEVEATLDGIVEKPGNSLRITGLSGLGKTRIIKEYFEKHNSAQTKFLYIDAGPFENRSSKITEEISNIRNSDYSPVLIIDNCPSSLQNDLNTEVINSKIVLVTLNHDPEEGDESCIKLSPEHFKEIIPKIIKDLFPFLTDQDVKKIEDFAQGFPNIAVLLSEQLSQNSATLGRLNKEDLIDKLLGINKTDYETRYILRACSLFSYFGFYEHLSFQRDFIAKNKKLCQTNIEDFDLAIARFNEVCKRFLDRGLLERRGRYLFLKPIPLALELAKEWWQFLPNDPNFINPLLEEISTNKLAIPLCEQTAKLDFVPEAKNTVKSLCGEQGPFGQAEVLNTKEGSRLFRALVEVNPQETVKTLERVFRNWTKEDLKGIIEGRRNLVWALEKLCFREETFDQAAEILLDFGAAENEPEIGNNSTSQFIHLFQIFLPATEASLEKRFEFLKRQLNNEDPDYLEIVLKALGRGLKARDFRRMGGAEYQGSGPTLKDYKPTNYSEIHNYWKNIILELQHHIINNRELKGIAKESLIHALRGICSVRGASIILPVFKELLNNNNFTQDESITLFKNVNDVRRFESNELTKKEEQELQLIIEKLYPKNFEDKYEFIISNPSLLDYHDYKNADEFLEIRNKGIEKLSNEFITNEKFKEVKFNIFFEGEQREGWVFGNYLAVKGSNSEKVKIDNLFKWLIKALKNTPKNQRNPSVLAGFLTGIKSIKRLKSYLNKVRNDNELYYFATYFTSITKSPKSEIFNLFPLVDEGKIPITEFSFFESGAAIKNLKDEDAKKLIYKISSYGVEGLWVAITMIYTYIRRNEGRWIILKNTLRELLLKEGMLNFASLPQKLDGFKWAEIVQKLLQEDEDVELAKHVTNEIIKYCSFSRAIHTIDDYVKSVLEVLFDYYFNEVWPSIGEALLDENNTLFFLNFKHISENTLHPQFDASNLLIKGNQKKLISWCKQNSPKGPKKLAHIVPRYSTGVNEGEGWHPLAKKLIDKFGDIDEVRKALEANLNTFSWTGSLVPLFQAHKKLFKELENHNIKEVRIWARGNIEQIDKRIEEQKNWDEEEGLSF